MIQYSGDTELYSYINFIINFLHLMNTYLFDIIGWLAINIIFYCKRWQTEVLNIVL